MPTKFFKQRTKSIVDVVKSQDSIRLRAEELAWFRLNFVEASNSIWTFATENLVLKQRSIWSAAVKKWPQVPVKDHKKCAPLSNEIPSTFRLTLYFHESESGLECAVSSGLLCICMKGKATKNGRWLNLCENWKQSNLQTSWWHLNAVGTADR